MAKSIHKRFIRAWKLRFRAVCDSKVSAHWQKRDLKSFLRESGIVSANSFTYSMAESLAKQDFQGNERGWSPEFSAWFDKRRQHYMQLAKIGADKISDDEIHDLIEEEISCWGG